MSAAKTKQAVWGLTQGKNHTWIITSLLLALVCQPIAQAQFVPIPLSGGSVVKMTADYQRPYIYAIQTPASGATNGNLLFINTTNNTIDKTLVIGINPTDLTINYAEGRLYIGDGGRFVAGQSGSTTWPALIYVVDLTNQTLLPSLSPVVIENPQVENNFKINSKLPGRLVEETDSTLQFLNTTNGSLVNRMFNLSIFNSSGDGKMDPTGSIYYHCDGNSSIACVHKYQISNDSLVGITNSLQTHAFGTYNLILSQDGSTLFWNGYVYNTNLNELGRLGAEVYACTSNGAAAFSSSQVLDAITFLPMYNLPVQSYVMSMDGSGQRLWYSNSATNGIESIAMAIMGVPSIIQQPTNQITYSGNNAVVSVGAAGLEPLVYVWYLNGTNFATTSYGHVVVTNYQAANVGNYSVTVSNSFGSVTSSNAVLSIQYAAPIIVSQPTNSMQLIGTSAVFSINVTGSFPMNYQWQLNGINISGATNPVLCLTNLQITDEGYYNLTVTNTFGSTTSSNAYLNVVDTAEALNTTNLIWTTGGDLPWFVQTDITYDGVAAMQSGAITANQQSTVQTTVTGPGTLTFWWNVSSAGANDYLNFTINGAEQLRISGYIYFGFYGWEQHTNYIGAGFQTLQWGYIKGDSAVGPRDSGWLDVVSFVPGGTPPFVTVNPTSQVVLLGSNATFNASALGTPSLYYQWQLNLTNVDGATNASLALTNVQFTNEGNYTLVVSNAFGVTNTASVYLNIVDFTESLNSTNLIWSSGGNQPWFPETSVTHDGIAALQSGAITGSQQSTVQTTVNGPGILSFWWQVSSETNNDYANFSIDGSEQFRISGTVNWQKISYAVAPGTHTLTWSYSKNATINTGSDAAWLDQVDYAPGATTPSITVNPANVIAKLGQVVTFQVTALGTPPLFYQWQFTGTNITNATNAILNLPPGAVRATIVSSLAMPMGSQSVPTPL